MSKLKQLREKRGEKIAAAQAIVAKAETENRDLSAEEGTQVDTLTKEAEELGPQIARLEKVEKLAADSLQPTGPKSQINIGDAPELGGDEQKKKLQVELARQPKSKIFLSQEEAYRTGMFYLAVIFKQPHAIKWCQEHGLSANLAMSTDVDTKGGHFVPHEASSRIIDLRNQYGIFRSHAYIEPMSRDAVTIPREVGGLTVYAVGENQEITSSDQTTNQVGLVAKKWGCLAKYSSEVSTDAVISIADRITRAMAWAYAKKEDEIGFTGDGTSTYHRILGLKNALLAGSIYTAAAGNLAFGTLDLADYINALAKVPAYARATTHWFFSQAGWDAGPGLIMGAAGGNTGTDLTGKPVMRFLGYPVAISEVLPTSTGDQASTILGYVGSLYDAATLGDREGLAIAASDQRYFELDQLAIRGTSRFDINIHEVGTASAAGPIVAIKTPGS